MEIRRIRSREMRIRRIDKLTLEDDLTRHNLHPRFAWGYSAVRSAMDHAIWPEGARPMDAMRAGTLLCELGFCARVITHL